PERKCYIRSAIERRARIGATIGTKAQTPLCIVLDLCIKGVGRADLSSTQHKDSAAGGRSCASTVKAKSGAIQAKGKMDCIRFLAVTSYQTPTLAEIGSIVW